MLLTTLLPLILIGSASAAPANVCSSAPYNLFLPLSTFAPATSFCSSKYPVAPSTSIVTSTVISTVTSTVSLATTDTAVLSVSQNVVSTTVETDTTTVTISVTAIVTAGANKLKREADVTVASAAKGPFKQDVDVEKRSMLARGVTSTKKTTTTTSTTKKTSTSSKVDPQASKWSSLSAAIGSKLSTACSCIETRPTISSTTTTTQYTTVPQTVINTVQTTVFTTITIVDVDTETTATTTTTTATVATSTLQPATSCAAGGLAAGGGSLGCTYHTYCNTIVTFGGATVVVNGATTLSDCTVQCDNDANCIVAQFNTVTNTCTFLDGLGGPNGCGAFQYTSDPDIDSAVFVAGGNCGFAGQSCSGS